MNALVPASNVDAYRASTDAAALCKDIVIASAMEIQERKYVRVEGWQAIAIAHGCTASARDVERVDGGVRAIGEVRRMSDGAVIAEAEGFVGEDEPTWYGGTTRKWKWGQERGQKIWYDATLPKRPDYAIRAMAQTRAISRACRSAFAHVVVMMNAGLSTTPAEEVPFDGFDHDDEPRNVTPAPESAKTASTPAGATAMGWQALDNEMDRCKTKAALNAWNLLRTKEIKALPRPKFEALQQKFIALIDSLPDEVVADPKSASVASSASFDLSEDEIPEFA